MLLSRVRRTPRASPLMRRLRRFGGINQRGNRGVTAIIPIAPCPDPAPPWTPRQRGVYNAPPRYRGEILVDTPHTAQETESNPAIDRLLLVQTMLKINADMIKFADRKAQMLLRLALGLFMVAFVGVPPAVVALRNFVQQGGWKLALFIGVAVLYIVCSTCLVISIMKIIHVIRPRLRLEQIVPTRLFFGSVAQMSLEDFRILMRNIDYDDAIDDWINQAYQTAQIAQVKYQKLNEALSWMLGGGVTGVVFALILLISSGLFNLGDMPGPGM
jgi:hypothetical protein